MELEMITFEMAEKANDYIRDEAKNYAKWVATRENLDEHLKVIEATLMNQVDGAEHVKKAYARSHHQYLTNIEGRKSAREEEIKLRWELTAAQAKIDMWRSYNKTHSMGA